MEKKTDQPDVQDKFKPVSAIHYALSLLQSLATARRCSVVLLLSGSDILVTGIFQNVLSQFNAYPVVLFNQQIG